MQKNQYYFSIFSEIDWNKKTLKQGITSDPYYVKFEYRKTRKGYWGGNYATLQLEDIIDLFKPLFDEDYYQLVFKLDYSQTHKKFNSDAFIIRNFNHQLGGISIPIVYNINVGLELNNLRLFEPVEKLNSSDLEVYTFKEWYLPSFCNHNQPKYDTIDQLKEYLIPQKELEEELKKYNISIKGNVNNLQHQTKCNHPLITIKKLFRKTIAG